MSAASDNANVIVRPPIAWALSFAIGLALDWLYPAPFFSPSAPHVWVGAAILIAALVLAILAIATMRRAGTQVETHKPTSAIVTSGPYQFTRNPIYLGMLVGLVGLAIAFNSLWILGMLVPFCLVIRYGVIAREEAYLERKFAGVYLDYKSRIRRWL